MGRAEVHVARERHALRPLPIAEQLLHPIYPDSAHGFLFQHHDWFAADVSAFLDDATTVRRGDGAPR